MSSAHVIPQMSSPTSSLTSSLSLSPLMLVPPDFSVYVIESSEALDELKRKLSEAGPIISVCIMKRWDVDKKVLMETKNKNRVMCKSEVMTEFLRGYPDYKEHVEDYKWSTFPYPKQDKGETTDLHITCIPNDYTQQEADAIIANCLSNIGLPREAYTMKFPLKSRETGAINGFCHLIPNKTLDIKWVYIIKLLLHHMPIKAKHSNHVSNIVAIWYIEGKKVRNSTAIATSMTGNSMSGSSSAEGYGYGGYGHAYGYNSSHSFSMAPRGISVMSHSSGSVPRRQLPSDISLPSNIAATSKPVYLTSISSASASATSEPSTTNRDALW